MSARSPTFYILFSVATSVVTMALKFGPTPHRLGRAPLGRARFHRQLPRPWWRGDPSYAHSGRTRTTTRHEKAEYFSSASRRPHLRGRRGHHLERDPAPLARRGPWSRWASPRASLGGRARTSCAGVLLKGAREHRSLTLEADAHTCSPTCGPTGASWRASVVTSPLDRARPPDPPTPCPADPLDRWSLIRRSFDGSRTAPSPRRPRAHRRLLGQEKARGGDYHRLRTPPPARRASSTCTALVPAR